MTSCQTVDSPVLVAYSNTKSFNVKRKPDEYIFMFHNHCLELIASFAFTVVTLTLKQTVFN